MDAVRRVADEVGQTPARLVLAWVVGRRAVCSTPMGVSRAAQVADNIAALDLALPTEHLAVLDEASLPAEPRLIYGLSRPPLRQHVVLGGSTVQAWSERRAR